MFEREHTLFGHPTGLNYTSTVGHDDQSTMALVYPSVANPLSPPIPKLTSYPPPPSQPIPYPFPSSPVMPPSHAEEEHKRELMSVVICYMYTFIRDDKTNKVIRMGDK